MLICTFAIEIYCQDLYDLLNLHISEFVPVSLPFDFTNDLTFNYYFMPACGNFLNEIPASSFVNILFGEGHDDKLNC